MIRVENEGEVTAIFLARPERRNAMTPGMFDALAEAIRGVPSSARALVVAGDGPVFCSGFDLRLCLERPGTLRQLLVRLSGTVRMLRALPAPVVMSVHGAAVAGGCALLGGADVVVCNAGATLGYPVVRLGISPAVSAPFLRQCVPDGACRARLLDSGLISGAEAHRIGLVHSCVSEVGEVLTESFAIARKLAAKPRCGLNATKSLLNELAGAGADGPESAAERALNASLAIVDDPEVVVRLGSLWKS